MKGDIMVSPAQRKAIKKYQSEKTSELRIRVRNEQKERIDAYAHSIGKSTRAYILGLITEDMEKAGRSLE